MLYCGAMPSARSVSTVQHRVRRSNPAIVAMRRSLAAVEGYSPGRIEAYQERRLRALVRWAARRSPFYREWFAGAGVDPSSIRGLADLERLPLIDRSHLAERPDDFLAYPKRMVWASHSSGTTGTPVTAYRSVGSSMFELASLQRQWGWFGIPPGQRSVELRGSTFAGDDPDTIVLHNPGANKLLVSSYRLSAGNVPRIVEEITRFGPATMEGWPSSLSLLAGLLREAGVTIPVRGVIVSSEVISPGQARLLGEVFGGPLIDHYGQTERVVMAGSCEAGGYHLFPAYGILETLPVGDAAGEREIVGTPLHNWAFPLLRYRTGDRVADVAQEPCDCGRAFPRFGLVGGRTEDLVRTREGRPVPLASSLVDDLVGVREAQLVQHRPGVFEIRMVPGAGYDRAAAEARAREVLHQIGGPSDELSFTELDALPRSASGKLRLVQVLDSGGLADQRESTSA
jgi:phenylacetate-CoA ligase